MAGAASPLLLCLPYAGGDVHVYRGWQRELGTLVRVEAAALPGRGRRMAEPPCRTVHAAVGDLLRQVARSGAGELLLFGHSMGALLAFELARALQARSPGLVRHLFVAGLRAPSRGRIDPPLHALPEGELVAALRRLGGTPDEVLAQHELLQLLMPRLRADFEVCETYGYRPAAPLTVPITLYCGREDVDDPDADVAAWRRETSAAFESVVLPGGHFFVHAAAAQLLAHLRQSLARRAPALA